MLTAANLDGQVEGRPLKHRDCFAGSHQTGPGLAASSGPWVQVLRQHREGPYVLCGQVIELAGNETEWFKIETLIGPVWAEGRNLRMCSGDGRCTCEPDEAQPARAIDNLHRTVGATLGSTTRETEQLCGLQGGLPGQPMGEPAE